MDYLEEAQLAEESSGIKSHKLLLFIFFGIIFFIIILVVFLIFKGDNKNISSNKLIEGVALEVGESDVITFDLDEEEHGMFINFVGDGSVELTISSEPINLSLNINEIKEVDLNNDGVFDLKIKLVSIVEEKAVIAFQKIEKESCKEDWECSEWSNCYKAAQKRKCTDLNSCGTIFDRPIIIKGCLETKFVEDDSAFETAKNYSLNTTLKNNSNTNLTNNTNTTPPANYTNQTTSTTNGTTPNNQTTVNNTTNTSTSVNNTTTSTNFTNNTTNTSTSVNNTTTSTNQTNITNPSVCSAGTFACYEFQGFFCTTPNYYYSGVSNPPLCCAKECLKFNSKEQLCYARGYLYFTSNETHICKVQVYSPFNGTNILCCASIDAKRNTTIAGFSNQI